MPMPCSQTSTAFDVASASPPARCRPGAAVVSDAVWKPIQPTAGGMPGWAIPAGVVAILAITIAVGSWLSAATIRLRQTSRPYSQLRQHRTQNKTTTKAQQRPPVAEAESTKRQNKKERRAEEAQKIVDFAENLLIERPNDYAKAIEALEQATHTGRGTPVATTATARIEQLDEGLGRTGPQHLEADSLPPPPKLPSKATMMPP